MTELEYEFDEEEITKERTPLELHLWVEERCELLGRSRESKIYGRSGKRLPKKFYEEVRPLSIYAFQKYRDNPNIQVRPNLGNENYDGLIKLPNDELIYVEITSAKDGYDKSLRLEVLEKGGSVNLLAPVEVSGTKASKDRMIKIPDDIAVSHARTVEKALNLIAERLCEKADSRYSRDHILIVVVDDYIAFREDGDLEMLKDFTRDQIQKLPLPFDTIVLLGNKGDVFFEFPNTNS